jgi:hypothetical protein
MNQDMKIILKVAQQADNLSGDAERFGEKAARTFRQNARAQITGLESIANSSLKISDVLDYIKTRTARSDRESAREKRPVKWSVERLGRELVEYLGKEIKEVRDRICADPELHLPPEKVQEVYLLLIREFIRQLAAHYEYAAAGVNHGD